MLGSSWSREGLARPSSLLKALDFDASDGFCPTQDEVPAAVCFLLGNKPGRGFAGGAVTTSRERKQLVRNAQVRGGYGKGVSVRGIRRPRPLLSWLATAWLHEHEGVCICQKFTQARGSGVRVAYQPPAAKREAPARGLLFWPRHGEG